MPKLRSRSICTPVSLITKNVDETDKEVRSSRHSKTVSSSKNIGITQSNKSLVETDKLSDVFIENQPNTKITPTRQNGEAKMSGEWEEHEIKEVQESIVENLEKTAESEKVKQQSNDETLEHGLKEQETTTTVDKTPQRRLTLELERSVNSIDILKRDSDQFSVLQRKNNGCFKKTKKPIEARNLRKKVNILLADNKSIENTPPVNFTPSNIKDETSVIEISSDSSFENTSINTALNEKKRINGDLLKQTLIKKYNAKFVEAKDSSEKSFKRKQMPDFAALHKKQYDQMEDIASMTKRKEERAKLLLSGSKPSPLKTRNNIETIRAKLFPEHSEISAIENKNLATPKVHFSIEASDNPSFKFSKTPKPVPAVTQTHKERRKTKEGFTRYGFKKVLPKVQEKKTQILAVAQKTSVVCTASKEKRREILKGVRSNRRFELLMAMRKGRV